MMLALKLLRATPVSILCCLAIAIVTFSGCTGTFRWRLRPCITELTKELTKEQLRHFEVTITVPVPVPVPVLVLVVWSRAVQ